MSDDYYAEQAAAAFYDYLSQDERDEARDEIAKLRALLQEARDEIASAYDSLCSYCEYDGPTESELVARIDEALKGSER